MCMVPTLRQTHGDHPHAGVPTPWSSLGTFFVQDVDEAVSNVLFRALLLHR